MIHRCLHQLVTAAIVILAACSQPAAPAGYILPGVTLPAGSVIAGSDDSPTAYQVGYVFDGSRRAVQSVAVWFDNEHGWEKVSGDLRTKLVAAGMTDHTEQMAKSADQAVDRVQFAMSTSVNMYQSPDKRYIASVYNNAAIREVNAGFLPPRLGDSAYLLVVIDYGMPVNND